MTDQAREHEAERLAREVYQLILDRFAKTTHNYAVTIEWQPGGDHVEARVTIVVDVLEGWVTLEGGRVQ